MTFSLDAVLSSERLPSLPEVAARVIEIARDPDPDYDRLVEAIRTDPAIAGRILKTANSALLGMRTRATSIEQAVPRLGTTMVRTLVLSFSLADYQNRNSLNLRPYYQHIWRESLTQAAVAECLAERQGGKVDPANWFLAGLIQDIGRLALLHTCRDEYVKNVIEVEDERHYREREQQWLGFTHVEVSQGLCRRWNLDADIVDAIGVHHSSAHRVVPLKFVSSTTMAAALITAAHVAEYLEEVSHNLSCSREHIERLLMQVFALRPNDVFRVLADIDSRVGELSAAFGIDIGRAPSLETILSEAQELLGQIALASQLRLVNVSMKSAGRKLTREDLEENSLASSSEWRDQQSGAFSRSWFEHALGSVVEQSHQTETPFGLLFVAVDDPVPAGKNGDATKAEILPKKRITEFLKQYVRPADSVVLYGDREFVVTMADVNLDLLTLVSDQILNSAARDLSDCEPEPNVGIRIGATLYSPHGTNRVRTETILKEAQRALAEARRLKTEGAVFSVFESGKWSISRDTQNAMR